MARWTVGEVEVLRVEESGRELLLSQDDAAVTALQALRDAGRRDLLPQVRADKRVSRLWVICSTCGSRPARPWAQSVLPEVTTTPPPGDV